MAMPVPSSISATLLSAPPPTTLLCILHGHYISLSVEWVYRGTSLIRNSALIGL